MVARMQAHGADEDSGLLPVHEKAAAAQDPLRAGLLARVSHDLRTPLNGILGFTELMQAEASDSQQRTYLAAVHRSCRALQTLINDLLDVAGLDMGQITLRREPVPLMAVLADLRAATAGLLAESGVVGEWPEGGALPQEAVLDRRRIVQALAAVVDHGRRHTPAGGRVAVSAGADERQIVFMVTDGGPAIGATDADRAFTPYFIRDPRNPRAVGTGFGLAIARGVVERHGGRIDVAAVAGGGVRFTLAIPRRPAS